MRKVRETGKIFKKLAAFGMAVFMTGTLLAGCGNTDSDDSAGTSSGTSSADAASDSSGETSDNTLETVYFGTTTSLNDHYIALVGIANGFYEENGIDLQLVEFSSGIETVDAVTTGQIDIGKAADYAIVNRIGNTDGEFNGKLIARFESTQNYTFYVNPDVITSIEDLKGKDIIGNPGVVTDYLNAKTLIYAGLTEDDISYVNVSNSSEVLAVLEKEDADAAWAAGANAQKIEALGYVKLLGMEDIDVNVDDYYITSDDYISSNSDTLERFLKATWQSEEWISQNLQEAAEIIYEEIGVAAESAKANISAASLSVDFPEETITHLEDIQEFCAEQGFYDNAYQVKDFINVDILKAALPDAEVFE